MKGLLANLISVQDLSYATALEVVAGGRLYNIVVDTEVGLRVHAGPSRRGRADGEPPVSSLAR